MIQGIYSSTAGMINQEIMLDVITNNLANASTPGFKRDEVSFSGMFNSLPTPEGYIDNPLGIVNLDTVCSPISSTQHQVSSTHMIRSRWAQPIICEDNSTG